MPLYYSGEFMALSIPFSQSKVLPLFTNPSGCDAFIQTMGLTYYCGTSNPLFPRVLKRVVTTAREAGFDAFTLDPQGFWTPSEIAPIENLLEQVEAKL